MKIRMVSIGSTGDVRPYVLLGQELQRRGHQVTIIAFSAFETMTREAGLTFRPLAGDVNDLMARIMKPGVQGVGFLVQVKKALGQIAPVLLRDLMDAFDGAEAMICNFFGSVYYSVAEKYGIPVVQTQYFPMDMCDDMPISSAPGWFLPQWNRGSYRLGYWLIHVLERWLLTRWRRENGMTVPRIHGGPDYDLPGQRVQVVYAMSPLVVPRPAMWGDNIHMSGFWMDTADTPYTPDPALRAFLNDGEPPLYIGFGSMVSGDMDATFAIVTEAVRSTGLRVLLDRGWAGAQVASLPNAHVMTGFVPHSWLFPRTRGVVHHGGAGTTASGLRAGCPTLVIPFGGDQPFWGKRVHALGCGPAPIPREKLTVPALSSALEELATTPAYAEAARAIGEGLRQEQGVVTAADLVEQAFGCARA